MSLDQQLIGYGVFNYSKSSISGHTKFNVDTSCFEIIQKPQIFPYGRNVIIIFSFHNLRLNYASCSL